VIFVAQCLGGDLVLLKSKAGLTLLEAQDLIASPLISKEPRQQWADLGCGDGLFSKALLTMLPDGSIVHAIDQTRQSFSDPNIKFQKLNFEKDELVLPLLNGILMANSLHFIKDKIFLLRKLKNNLLPGGSFILIEYDLSVANRWVPYPLNYIAAIGLFKEAGFGSIEKITERKSVFNSTTMYSLHIR
jgi:ubiquinone/menaquinone biosynthesis C-methylase UbiE